MPLTTAPGLTFDILDFSQAVRRLGDTRVLMVGAAERGPLNTPTAVNSEAEFIRTFGVPLSNDYGAHAAVRYLRRGRGLVYLRVAGASAATASASFAGRLGGSVATKSSTTITINGGSNPTDGDTLVLDDGDIDITFEFDDDANVTSGNIPVSIGADALSTTGNLLSAIRNSPLAMTVEDTTGSGSSNGELTVTLSYNGSTRETAANSGSSATGSTPPSLGTFSGGAAPAVPTGVVTFSGQPTDADTVSIDDGDTSVTYEFDNNNSGTSGNRLVQIGDDAAETAQNFRDAVNNAGQSLSATYTAAGQSDTGDYHVRVVHQNTGTDGNNAMGGTATNVDTTGLDGGEAATSPSAIGTAFTLNAKTPGTGANGMEVVIQPTAVSGAPPVNFDLLVRFPEDPTLPAVKTVVERYNNVSLDSNSDRYIETVLDGDTDEQAVASRYVTVDTVKSGAEAEAGTFTFSGGHNGIEYDSTTGNNGLLDSNGDIVATAYIGTSSGNTATGMKAVRDPEKATYTLSAVPGVSHRQVVNELIDLAESRGDHLAILDLPEGLTTTQAIQWHNGTAAGISGIQPPPTVKLDTEFAAAYWPWVEVENRYDTTNKTAKITLPPSGDVLGAIAASDRAASPWFAPAGHTRGRLDVLGLEYSPDADEQAQLLRDGNAINPIVDFASGGPTIWGNSTLLRRSSMLQQVHVIRLVIYARRVLATSLRFVVFEPTDPVTMRRIKQTVNPVLETIAGQQGLADFRVIVDESINPPEVLNQRKLNAQLLLKPYNAVEELNTTFAIFSQGVGFPESI